CSPTPKSAPPSAPAHAPHSFRIRARPRARRSAFSDSEPRTRKIAFPFLRRCALLSALPMANTITSPVFVVRDNIDTDQIIPAQYLTLVPTKPEEYDKLGSYALVGLPDDAYPVKFVPSGTTKTPYK